MVLKNVAENPNPKIGKRERQIGGTWY